MEMFKTDILKKEFEKFQKENFVEILKYCQKTACQSWHQKFLVICKYCREAFCKACHNFNIAKETLFKVVDSIGKESMNFQVDIVRVPIEKTCNVKSYHKSNKNRSQVVYKKFGNCKNISYAVKGKPHTFYKKL